MSNDWYMKKPCAHCPFRRDVTPFLRPARASEIAYLAQNPYSDFPCHKTTVSDEDSDEGRMYATAESKTCAGFMAMQINECGEAPQGWEWPGDVYSDPGEMIDAYEEEWNRRRRSPSPTQER